jgi:hypothetical protein
MKGLFPLAALFLFSCTANRLTSSWTASTAGVTTYQKIMVVGVIQNEDSLMRREMEAHMVSDLKSIGYNAVAFTESFGSNEFRLMRYDSVRKKLLEQGIDGVITINLLAKEKEQVYVKDKINVKPDNTPLGSFWEAPVTVKQDIGKPGYYVTNSQYYWESRFYDVSSVALLYAAQSTAFDVSSTQSLAHKYGKTIVNDLQKNYVLTAKNN